MNKNTTFKTDNERDSRYDSFEQGVNKNFLRSILLTSVN